MPAACCNTGPRPSRAARTASEGFVSNSCLRATPCSWWALQPGVGRRVSLLTHQTVWTMGNRSLITAPRRCSLLSTLQCAAQVCANCITRTPQHRRRRSNKSLLKPGSAWGLGTPAICMIFMFRFMIIVLKKNSHTQIYKQTMNRT